MKKRLDKIKNRNSKIINVFFVIVFISQINLMNAQNNKDNLMPKKDKDSATEKSYFKFSNSFLTNDVYNGRQDSIVKPYLKPSIGYFNKSGFAASITGFYLTLANQNRFDSFSLDMNYSYHPTSNFTTGISANRTFYSKSSTALTSSSTGSLGANLGYDFGFIEIMAQGNVLFSEKKDFGLNIEFLHEFIIGKDGTKFAITPTFDIDLSTLNYYGEYVSRKISKGKAKSNPNTTTITSQTFVNNNHFTLLSYEASLPVSYEINHFVLFVIPTLAIPQNPIYTTTTTTTKSSSGSVTTISENSTPNSEYNLKNKIFAEIGLYYKL
ncbi:MULTISPECIES: hypothetical protein [unclassified Flavobacterium]|jgi:hypothetical protein|uniref:hypothetical protein n=1 Tax=unclassified Flavobacterium TaxID=196869 RepID=UPI0025B831AD|nr:MULTISPECIES: hypothetical protein [unclassified Flavobacterium]